MGKRIEIDGEYFRERRGIFVKIPVEWVGVVVFPQNIRKRKSKKKQKMKKDH